MSMSAPFPMNDYRTALAIVKERLIANPKFVYLILETPDMEYHFDIVRIDSNALNVINNRVMNRGVERFTIVTNKGVLECDCLW
jgi:hypothetical protein